MDDESEAFTALYREHYRSVLGFALRRAVPDVAKDVVAEVFLVAWRRRDEPRRAELPWLLAVARNVLRQQSRSGARRAALDNELSRLNDLTSGVVGDIAAEISERSVVLSALGTLSESDREALMLLAWDGLSPADAAAVIGCPTATFRVRSHRARKRLATALRQMGAEMPMRGGPIGRPGWADDTVRDLDIEGGGASACAPDTCSGA